MLPFKGTWDGQALELVRPWLKSHMGTGSERLRDLPDARVMMKTYKAMIRTETLTKWRKKNGALTRQVGLAGKALSDASTRTVRDIREVVTT